MFIIKKNLGNTGIKVTELCFGTLPMGPLQANVDLKEGANLILKAMDDGINFFDTAQMYRTYPYLREALRQYQDHNIVIATKSACCDYLGMEQAVQEALRELGRDYIDIFHLHAARLGPDIFKKAGGAIECLQKYKEKGYIRAIGLATHHAAVTWEAAKIDWLDVVFPIINKKGLGIIGGSLDDMSDAVKEVKKSGKGLYAMKCLGGGNLIGELEEAVGFVRRIDVFDAIAIGMVSEAELDTNIRIFNGQKPEPGLVKELLNKKRLQILLFLCKGCGKCVSTCPNQAIKVENDKAVVDSGKCILCGYCNPECPEFAIRVR